MGRGPPLVGAHRGASIIEGNQSFGLLAARRKRSGNPWLSGGGSPYLNRKPEINGGLAYSQKPSTQKTTLNNGYLGSRNDEERSEVR